MLRHFSHCGAERLNKAAAPKVRSATRTTVSESTERADELIAGNGSGKTRGSAKSNDGHDKANEAAQSTQVVCIPARDQADELATFMMAQLLTKRGIGARALSSADFGSDPCRNPWKS